MFVKLQVSKSITLLSLVLSIISSQTVAVSLNPTILKLAKGHPVIQFGGFLSYQGKAQFGGIQGEIGDFYTIRTHQGSNFLLGAGYYLDGTENNLFNLSYGVNAFYLPKTFVHGYVVQELMFTNLEYDYSITNIPVFGAAKATFNTISNNYALTLDTGIGPNFMSTARFYERHVTGSTCLSDHSFSGHASTAFAAMIGAGIKLKNIFNTSTPLECGYRFFYLGGGELSKNSDQLLNTLKTGQGHANALLCSVMF